MPQREKRLSVRFSPGKVLSRGQSERSRCDIAQASDLMTKGGVGSTVSAMGSTNLWWTVRLRLEISSLASHIDPPIQNGHQSAARSPAHHSSTFPVPAALSIAPWHRRPYDRSRVLPPCPCRRDSVSERRSSCPRLRPPMGASRFALMSTTRQQFALCSAPGCGRKVGRAYGLSISTAA